MKLSFWGVRGSIPAPSTGDFRTDAFGGNTTCVSFDSDRHHIAVDGGTGIVNYFKGIKTPVYHVVFSHYHHDHIQGMPFFVPLFLPTTTIHYHAPHIMPYDVEEMLNRLFDAPMFPYKFQWTPSKKFFSTLDSTESIRLVEIDTEADYDRMAQAADLQEDWQAYSERYPNGLNQIVTVPNSTPKLPGEVAKLTWFENLGHPQGTFVYRMDANGRSVVFATDIEGHVGSTTKLVELSKGADLLIHDAQYDPEEYHRYQNFGHSTYEMAADAAIEAGVKELLLTHHDPGHDDSRVEGLIARCRDYMKAHGGSHIALDGAREGQVWQF